MKPLFVVGVTQNHGIERYLFCDWDAAETFQKSALRMDGVYSASLYPDTNHEFSGWVWTDSAKAEANLVRWLKKS